jgi:hypothetical protein
VWIDAFIDTAHLVGRMGVVMFISLFGVELLMQLGAMRFLRPIGRPVARLANLPTESAVSFLAGIGSMIAAHTISAQNYKDGHLTPRELVLTGVLNTVPFHFKETFTFQLPVVLPLLGPKLGLIYITAFWLTGVLKIVFVMLYGRLKLQAPAGRRDAFEALACNPAEQDCSPRSWRQLTYDTWQARRTMFGKMILILAAVTLAVQLLFHSGALAVFERLVLPLTAAFNLPPVLVGPMSAYLFSPTAGMTFLSSLLEKQLVTDYQAIVALLAASMLMIPFMRLRRTLPRYIAYYGARSGSVICGLTTLFALLSRLMILAGVLLFY